MYLNLNDHKCKQEQSDSRTQRGVRTGSFLILESLPVSPQGPRSVASMASASVDSSA